MTHVMADMIADAMLAPSVHNVQPARWRIIGDDVVVLLEDSDRRLLVGDPSGHDADISLGAAAEGLRMAAAAQGYVLESDGPVHHAADRSGTERYRPVASFRLRAAEVGAAADPLHMSVHQRQSWRAPFARPSADDRRAAMTLAGDDCAISADAATLRLLAALADRASFGFIADDGFRAELRGWMRFSRRDARWSYDGLNADAMAMNRVEAWGASLVLGPLFRALNAIGLARPLVGEGAAIASAAAMLIFHRPRDEAPFVTGAHFYRRWLAVEWAGLAVCVVAALADDRDTARDVAAMLGLAPDRRIVSAWRIGRRTGATAASRARLPMDQVILS